MSTDTTLTESGRVLSLYDGPDQTQGGPDHLGNVWPTADGWVVTVARKFEHRDEAVRVLEFVSDVSREDGE